MRPCKRPRGENAVTAGEKSSAISPRVRWGTWAPAGRCRGVLARGGRAWGVSQGRWERICRLSGAETAENHAILPFGRSVDPDLVDVAYFLDSWQFSCPDLPAREAVGNRGCWGSPTLATVPGRRLATSGAARSAARAPRTRGPAYDFILFPMFSKDKATLGKPGQPCI